MKTYEFCATMVTGNKVYFEHGSVTNYLAEMMHNIMKTDMIFADKNTIIFPKHFTKLEYVDSEVVQ